ncbi:unnamed protein product, partial [Meganyctiphanes norvegica]
MAAKSSKVSRPLPFLNLYRRVGRPLVTTAKVNNSSLNLIAITETSFRGLQTSCVASAWEKPQGPQKWQKYNDKVFPPLLPGEESRPAYVCHQKDNIKYSPDKMWYVACLIRGMKIDDAINQLKFVHKKGAVAVLETLQEAQELAVKEHNVEFRSNLWVVHPSNHRLLMSTYRTARIAYGKVSPRY